ncbi:MAG: hypothetical protein IKQ15_05225 [Kiritimatiellae bacterium]|nr:hypothetical protein [Kiritimatiellia bacterium]
MNHDSHEDRHLAYIAQSSPSDSQSSDETGFLAFHPRLTSLFLEGESPSWKSRLVRLYFFAMTRGKLWIAYARSTDNQLMHTSCVVPRCFKFPFLGKNDFEIGPCLTYPEFRRQGLYVQALRYIARTIGNSVGQPSHCYMFVRESNIASVKGIERAGFSCIGTAEKSRWLKIYRLKRDNIND